MPRSSFGRILLVIFIVLAVPAFWLSKELVEGARRTALARLESDARLMVYPLRVADFPRLRYEVEKLNPKTGSAGWIVLARYTVSAKNNDYITASTLSDPTDIAKLLSVPIGGTRKLTLTAGDAYVHAVDVARETAGSIDDVSLVVGRRTPDEAETATWNGLIVGWTAYGSLLLLGLTLGFWYERRYLRRLDRINDLLDRAGEGELTVKVDTKNAPTELVTLGRHIDAMLKRIASLMMGLRLVSERTAHELKTPLTRMSKMLDKLDEGALDETSGGVVGQLKVEIDTIIRVFNSLLQLARVQTADGRELEFTTVDLTTLLDELGESFETELLGEFDDSVEMEFEPDPSHAFACEVERGLVLQGDRSLLQRMVWNLLENARKYAPAGAEIRLRAWQDAAGPAISVSNTGSEFPDDFADRAFDPLARASSVEQVAGVGLGLDTVRAIAVRHGLRARIVRAPDVAEVLIKTAGPDRE